MKKSLLFVIACCVTLIYASKNSAADGFSNAQKQSISNSLVQGLHSPNSGLKVSSALRIFELLEQQYLDKKDFSNAVIPLMNMLREGNMDVERIAAALALYKIEDMRGIYHLGGTSKYSSSQVLNKITKNLYLQYHVKNKSAALIDF